MTDNAAMRTVLMAVLTMGSVDMVPRIEDYSHLSRLERTHKVKLDWDNLERAMTLALREYESHGCMIWEVPTSRFIDEYLKLVDLGG